MKRREVARIRVLSLFMSMAMLCSNVPASMIGSVTGSDVGALSNVNAAADYGLMDNIQDGTILHCFDWKYSDIQAELPNIAKAGFTSVQTSPAQRNDSFGEPWYMMYQPQNFAITTNPIGTKAELQSLCEEAEKYGIKVVVDVVANHTRGMDGENGNIDNNLKRRDFFRYGNKDSGAVDWKNRYEVYSCNIGMRDLVSENTDLQNIVAGYISELQSVGVDGIRWDAAKHMQLPSEGSNFWPAVTSQGLFHYGEILDGPNNGGNNNDTLMKEYTNYITVTDDGYGHTVLNSINSGNVPGSIGNYSERGVAKNKLIYWPESHDTYSNNGEYGSATQWIDQNKVDRAYAILAAQDKATTLYFSRPAQTEKSQIKAGEKGSTHFTSKEVAAVNHFHNAMSGQKEYYVNSNNNTAAVCRETGAVVVKGSGNGYVSMANGGSTTKPGTYYDEITGNKWIVTETTISGEVGSSGIAVFYEETNPAPCVTISKEGGKFHTDTLELTVGLKNATSGTYQVGNEAAKTFTSTTTLTIGSDMAYGDKVTVKLTATDGTETVSSEYTFEKVEQKANIAYFSLPAGWSEPVYCYAYDAATETVNNGKWPGVQMTKDAKTGYYAYEIPENIEAPRVIFYSSEVNRTPADQEKGYLFSEEGAWLYKDGSWSKYTAVVEKEPKVTSSLTEGATFQTETKEITLTLENAETGTYSVDNGPVKTFTGSTKVVLGQGKVADSIVTVKTTATKGSTTKEYTFTYNKAFNGTINEVNAANAAKEELAKAAAPATATKLASQYQTNTVGFGANKTIAVDGNIADWDSTMLIAQGAANDDPRVYRDNSMYEVGVDLYALYGAYDDENLYLMWEMTNVQDQVAPNDNYPLSQGTLWQTQEFPFFIAVDTKNSDDAIGNSGALQSGGTIWNSGMTIANSFNRLISINTKGGNGPWVYGGDSTGLNAVEMLDAKTSKIKMNYGKGILSQEVNGIDKAYGAYNGRVVGDVCNNSAAWVDFVSKGHKSEVYDFFYEMSIPLEELGITKADITANGVGVLLVGTMGMSGLDCLPYDTAMNDNADLPDTQSQENNSYEKSDADHITTKFAYIGKAGGEPVNPVDPVDPVDPSDSVDALALNFGADRSSPQEKATKLTLKGIAEGGKAPYTYEYYVNNKLVATKTGTSETSTSWVPTADEYVIACVVTDSNNNTVTSAKYYTIEGEKEVCKHEETEILNKKAATCEAVGYTGDTYCSSCGEIVTSGTQIEALKHDYSGAVTNKKAATCTEAGYTGDTSCTRCSSTKAGTTILAKGHDFTGAVKNKEAATCTEDGYTGDVSCKNCTEVQKGEVIPAEGHDWDDGEVITEATETETGLIEYTCEECEETKQEIIPILGTGVDVGDVVSDEDSDATYRVTKSNKNNKEVEYVVSDVKVKTVEIPATITIDDVEYKVTSIGSGAFKKNKTIKKVTIGKNVKKIGSKAFLGCKNLTTVEMKSVTTIGAQAFANCNKLESVTLSSKCKSIKAKAFYKCKALKTITIPSNVNAIGKQAFYGCKSLENIVILTKKLTKKNVGAKAFKGINATATITVPNGKLAAYKKVLKAKGVGSKVTITK